MNTKPVAIILMTHEASNGFVYEMTQHSPNSFDVDCWNPDGNNHWNKWFNDIDKAQAEYNRWLSQ